MAQRLTPRIVPPDPITVAVAQNDGPPVAYGVIADISGRGACVWTDGHLAVGATMGFRISFAQPPEIHDLVGRVVWDRPALPERGRKSTARCGVQWIGATQACRVRLGDLARRAVPSEPIERRRFQKAWRVSSS